MTGCRTDASAIDCAFDWSRALAVMVLALMPIVPHIMPSTGWDKSNHMLAFAVLAVLGLWAYPGRMAVLLLGLLAYGGLIEVLQSFTPDRFAEWADLLADVVGLLVGAVLASQLRRFS